MPIRNIRIETRKVLVNEEPVELRGVNTDDLYRILTFNRESVELVFDLAEKHGINGLSELTEDKIMAVADAAIRELPELVAYAVAICEEDPALPNPTEEDLRAKVAVLRKLNLPTQMDLAKTLMSLTFGDATNFGTFVGKLAGAAKAVRSQLPAPPILASEHANGSQA